jgi:radical SAM superfamily enzyme YgiQ (UPF0313 family)
LLPRKALTRRTGRNHGAVDTVMAGMRARNVLMVYPRFVADSFFNFRAACEAIGRRSAAAPLGLITVAALLPPEWSVRFLDRNVEELAERDLEWADLVMTGGMIVQQRDTLDVIRICRARGIPVAVGGPDATSSPHVYREADFTIIGEAEDIMAGFVAAVEGGAEHGIFEAAKFQVDVTKSPIPRFDLLKLENYLSVGVQFSRGCPFTCEFCDIIELYGRVPRAKTNDQMLAELDALYRLGWRGIVEFVDDNLIGNKKALKAFLPELARWLRVRGHPFEFATEASINLADDDELLRLLREANFFTVFIGIESPDTGTLIAAKKKQNTRRSIAESIHKIYAAGIFVSAGFIVGFDTEEGSVSRAMVALIEDAALPVSMVALLTALPNTQLTRRLANEGRLHRDYEFMHFSNLNFTLNFETRRPAIQVMRDCQTVIRQIYDTPSYFGRVRRLARALDWRGRRAKTPIRSDVYQASRLAWHMMVRDTTMRTEVWKTVFDCLWHNPRSLRAVVKLSLVYLHLGPFSRYAVNALDQRIAFDASLRQRSAMAREPLPVAPI